MRNALSPIRAARTTGSRIVLDDGRELIDAVSSWWTACHGYNHPHIVAAMERQLHDMPHVMFGGLVHEPAERLAARLANALPGNLNRVFFADSGSVAVEIAMKMAVQFWLNQGDRGRTKFVSFRGAYHGDTLAAMSVADPDDGMHALFKGYLPRQFITDLPVDAVAAQALRELLHANRDQIAGVIVEPLVQCAGGMKMHTPDVLRLVATAAADAGLLLICDEIAVNFGRTGSMFGVDMGRGGGGRARVRRGDDLLHELELEFVDAALGTDVDLEIAASEIFVVGDALAIMNSLKFGIFRCDVGHA